MPAIRDWTFNYNTSTNATTIDCAVPSYQPGDLLLAIVSTDTGTQTWSCSGWTVLFSQTNTSNLAVLWKIASSSEPASYTFTYSTSETANAAILSIMDVDTTNPIGNNARANVTAARQAVPVTTASRDNSLIIYCWVHGSTAVIPSVIEGPVTQIISKDGSAHSDGFAWTFLRTAGGTPSNIYYTVTGTTYNGLIATVVINPPSSGAQVIPAYCVEDRCIYVDPIHGTTAFRGNSAFAGNATTYWTSPLAGRTLANATVSAKTDYGINTYRSCGGMTGPTTANTYQGATLVLADANRVDVRGKNVLVHAMPLVPADLQTVYDAGLRKGVEFGMASSANNAKVWHVHGANTPWDIRRVPIVVHPDNTSALIDSRGTLDVSLVKIFGFFVCGFLVSSDWVWTMIWVLDTTVVAGGTASHPVTIDQVVKVVADGHERMSAILQGKSEAMFFQPVQFGDGGNNPIYLDLSSTCIEFPEIYNLQKRLTNYCSVPNVVGITYYAGPNDVIIHKNAILISGSKYHWRFHLNTSLQATYDFTGLQIINAGDIQVVSGLRLSGITFTQCDEIDVNGCYFDNCIFKDGTGTGAVKVDSSTEMSRITNCTFTGNNYAIRLMSSSDDTYTFDGIKFSNNQKDVYVAATSGTVYINVTGGGDTPTYNSAGATVVVRNIRRLRISGLPQGSDVKILEAGTTNLIAGTDNSDTYFDFYYNYGEYAKVDIVVLHLDYEYFRIENYTLFNADSEFPVPLRRDKWYSNPA